MEQNSDDRFSDLPDEIVHSILSDLPITDLARLSAVSKRCRELCVSIPTLSVDVPLARSKSSRRGLYNFVDRLIARRSLYKVKTQRFSFVWSCQPTLEDEEVRMRTWLQHAVDSGVQDIYLEIAEHRRRFSFPSSVLACKTLRTLRIDACMQPFELPSSLSIPSFANKLAVLELVNLDADNLNTGNEGLGEWFSSFKSLRWLRLEDLGGIKTLAITNSSLETLIIEINNEDFQKIDIQKVQRLHHLFIDWDAGNSQEAFDSGEGFFFISGQFFWDVLASRQPKVYPEKAEGLVEAKQVTENGEQNVRPKMPCFAINQLGLRKIPAVTTLIRHQGSICFSAVYTNVSGRVLWASYRNLWSLFIFTGRKSKGISTFSFSQFKDPINAYVDSNCVSNVESFLHHLAI